MTLPACSRDSLLILGPTASGKTRLAVGVARLAGCPVLGVDSRQVYRGLDLCSGKDLHEYGRGAEAVALRLADCCALEDEFNLFDFLQLAAGEAQQVRAAGLAPLFCGGTGLYLDALIKHYRLERAPRDEAFRQLSRDWSLDELRAELQRLRPRQHNQTDLRERERLLRAIEVARAGMEEDRPMPSPQQQPLVFGTQATLPELKARITRRLEQRLQAGMVAEVAGLLESGLPRENLLRLGLEARWITRRRSTARSPSVSRAASPSPGRSPSCR